VVDGAEVEDVPADRVVEYGRVEGDYVFGGSRLGLEGLEWLGEFKENRLGDGGCYE
jgi:hypothetical protein